jgi:hypothetical protein
MLPAPFGDFMRPGFINTGALNIYNNYAHGLLIARELRTWGEICCKEPNITIRVRPVALVSFVPESVRRYSYDTPVYIAMPKARYDNMLVLSANKPVVGVPTYMHETVEATITGSAHRSLHGPQAEANDVELGQGTLGASKFTRINTIKGLARGKKAKALEPQTPKEIRSDTLYDRTERAMANRKPKTMSEQMAWSKKRHQQQKHDEAKAREENKASYERRQAHRAAQMDSETARDNNYAGLQPGANKRHGYKHVGLDPNLIEQLANDTGGMHSEKPRLADNKSVLVSQNAASGLNPASAAARDQGKGSDDNIAKMTGKPGSAFELLMNGSIPIVIGDKGEQPEKN